MSGKKGKCFVKFLMKCHLILRAYLRPYKQSCLSANNELTYKLMCMFTYACMHMHTHTHKLPTTLLQGVNDGKPERISPPHSLLSTGSVEIDHNLRPHCTEPSYALIQIKFRNIE